jgi:hypothetical protein
MTASGRSLPANRTSKNRSESVSQHAALDTKARVGPALGRAIAAHLWEEHAGKPYRSAAILANAACVHSWHWTLARR